MPFPERDPTGCEGREGARSCASFGQAEDENCGGHSDRTVVGMDHRPVTNCRVETGIGKVLRHGVPISYSRALRLGVSRGVH